MIISVAPMRIDFAGTTDLVQYARQYEGTVVNATVNKYYCVTVSRRTDKLVSLKSESLDYIGKRSEELCDSEEIIKYVLDKYGCDGINVSVNSDIPPGSGLGGSSALLTALVNGLAAVNPQLRFNDNKELAEFVCRIEIEELKAPIGKQDQYGSSLGGINRLDFLKDDSVKVTPINLGPELLNKLNQNLMMYYVGNSRQSKSILKLINKGISCNRGTIKGLDTLKRRANEIYDSLKNGNLERFADNLHDSWVSFKDLCPSVTNHLIDEFYNKALNAGASAGKIMGAGGGGCFLLYCKPEFQESVRKELGEYIEMPIKIIPNGAYVTIKD